MADTIPGVRWMLEYACPLRGVQEWTNSLLHQAKIYGDQANRADGNFRLHDEICVTGTRAAREADFQLPIYGFDVTQTFAPLSSQGLEKMCGACPAHAANRAVAGCSGWFYLPPTSSQLDEYLREVIRDLGLESAVEREFLATRLVWFGLWANSPLTRGALEVLAPLLNEFIERHTEAARQKRDLKGLEDFIRAIDAALEHDLVLQIELMPPGHTDFGWHSIFAHCPRCKAGAPLHPWKKTRSQTLICRVCDLAFDPSLTAQREPMERTDYDEMDLLKNLGAERYRTFAVNYLSARGARRAEAQKGVEDYISPDPAIDARIRQTQEKNQRKREWIRAVLLDGLGQCNEKRQGISLIFSYRFSAAEVEILLERCRFWKVEISSIRHHCADKLWDKMSVLTNQFESNEAAFAALRAQGCNELFAVGVFKVPDEVTEN